MRSLVQIIRRELVERKMLMIGSLAIGVVILFAPLLPGTPQASDTWNAVSMWWSIITLLGLAVYAGSSFVASELRENRFTFYLARPVSIRSLWAGKMIAACLLSLICAFLVVLPVTLTGNGLMILFTEADAQAEDALLLPVLVGITILLAAFGHTIGVVLRARSAWLLLDFVAISLAALIFVVSLRPLLMSFAFGLTGSVAGIALLLLAVMLLGTGYLGLWSGRTDLARVHRMTSITTAISLIAVVSAVAVYSWNVRSTRPSELRTIELVECGTLDCTPIFTGSAPGLGDYRPTFAVVGDNVIELPMATWAGTDPSGNVAAWLIATKMIPDPLFDFAYRSTEPDLSGSLDLGLMNVWGFALQGNRLAIYSEGNLTVMDLRENRLVRSMQIERNAGRLGNFALTFAADDQLLVIDEPLGTLVSNHRIRQIDIESAEITETGSFKALGFWRNDGHLVAREGAVRRVLDPVSGAVLTEREADDVIVSGDRAIFETGSRPVVLEVTDLEGSTIKEISLVGSADAVLGNITDDGRLAVAVRQSQFTRTAWEGSRLLLVDLESGATEEVAPDLVPARLQNPRVRGPFFLESLNEGRSRLVRFEPGREIKIIAGPGAEKRGE